MVPSLSAELLGQDLPFVQRVLDSLDDPIFVKDRQHRFIVFNAALCGLLGRPRDQLLGKSDPDFFPPEQVEEFWRLDDELFESGEPNENEEQVTTETGEVRTIWTRKYPVRDTAGEVVALVGIISDITALRQRMEQLDKRERETAEQRARLSAQLELIDAMEVPVISLWAGILLVPLVGEVSEGRAERVLAKLLAAIGTQGAKIVFLDISGVPTLTDRSAAKLVETVAAARLLGAEAEIVGVSPAIARLLVESGVDLSSVRTHGSLQSALRQAIPRLGQG